MNSKRVAPLLAAVALIAAGCGDGDGDGTVEDATTEPAGPAATAPPDASPSATTLDDADTTVEVSTTGAPGEPVTLRMVTPYCDDDLTMGTGSRYTPAVHAFLSQVDELSGGQIDVEVVSRLDGPEFCGLADGEQQVVEAVIDGDADLAWAGTRVFDTFGVTTFQALHAPLLVDSYPLQAAVLDSDIPAEMLAGLDTLGLEGLAVLAGGLRKPIGREAPLLGPDDWSGITFQLYRSNTQAAAVQALGATPTDVVAGVRDAGLVAGEIDGHEHSLMTYVIRGNHDFAPYVIANVNLWPETTVVLVNPDRLAALSAEHQTSLRDAAAAASAASVALHDQDAELLAVACDQGAVAVDATPEQFDALRAAVEPVYDDLRTDAQTADLIDQVEALATKVTTEPLEIPEGCASDEASRAAESAPDGGAEALLPGRYETGEMTREEMVAAAVAAGFDAADAEAVLEDEFDDHFVLAIVITDGTRWLEFCTADGGTPRQCYDPAYEVIDRSTIVLTELPPDDDCVTTLSFELTGAQLRLAVIDAECPGDPDLLAGHLPFSTMIYETRAFTRTDT